MEPLNAKNILTQEAAVNSLIEDNSGSVHQENNSKLCLLSNIDVIPEKLTEAQGCNVLNIQCDLKHEDGSFAHPPSKKLKTEQNIQAEEMVADCLIDTQADEESENKIIEGESQPSDIDILLRTTNLLPGDKNKNYVNASSEETVTSSGVTHNRIDCFSESEKIKINEAKEIKENETVTKSKIFTAKSQEQTFMDLQLKQLNYQEICHLSQETQINTTKGPSCNNSDVESSKKERIILEDQNNMPQNREISLNDECYEKNNYFSPAKETNQSESEAGSERNKTASEETSSGNYTKEIACLLNEDKNNLVENEPITKPETCEQFILSDTITDIQHNHNQEGNIVTPSDVIITPNVREYEEKGCVIPAESEDKVVDTETKGDEVVNTEAGDEVVNTEAERSLHSVIFEHKTSWRAKLQDEAFKLVDVPCDSAAYTKIKELFQNTTQKHFQVNKIVEVQNPFLYGCYLLKKAEMESRYGCIKEEYLFHGTKIKNISSICDQNLDWRKHGSVTGNIFGRGASLTPISCYASHYSDKHQEEKIMFVFKVVIANETEGNPDMVIPPYKDTFKKLRYDTAIKPNRQVVVKFSDHEFYPEYLLYYTGEYRSYVYYDYFDDDSD